MAEYIDRNELLSVLNDKYESIADINSIIIDMASTNLIKEEKIDKVVEEIRELYAEWENSTDEARLETNPFGAVLNILQRNIGE